jgi:3D (Asp-Asp-Asp) domain-containing protein
MRNFFVGLSLVILLLLSITVGNIHIHENERLNLILDEQKEIIKQSQITEDTLRKEILRLRGISTTQTEEIDKKNKQLELLHNEIEKLKKQKSPSVSVMPSRGGTDTKRTINVIATAYVSYCDTGCIGLTKTNIDVSKSITHNGMAIIAVDPNVIKLHSIVKVTTENDSFIAYAGDTGGAIKGLRIDVLVSVNNTQKAISFGKKNATVTILKEG